MKSINGKVVALACVLTFAVGGTAAYLGLSAAGLIKKEGTEIIFTVQNDTKAYDGNGFTFSATSVSFDSSLLHEGHTPVATFEQPGVDVGSYSVGCNIKIVDENNVDVSANYNISIVPGTYTITKRPLKIGFNEVSAVYSGSYVDLNGVYATNNTTLVTGHHFTVDNYNLTKYVEDTDEFDFDLVNVSIKDLNNKDVTNNYNVILPEDSDCPITIAQRNLTIKPKDINKVYDGKISNCSEYQITAGSLAPGDSVICTYEELNDASAGENEIEFLELDIVNSSGISVIDNYNVTELAGYVNIDKAVLTVSVNDVTVEYGNTVSVSSFVFDFDGFVEKDQAAINAAKSALTDFSKVALTTAFNITVNPGTYACSFTYNNTNVYQNYFVNYKPCTITVTKNTIQVPSPGTSATLKYTGNALNYVGSAPTNSGYSVSGNSATEIGTYNCIYSLANKDCYRWSNGSSNDIVYTWAIVGEEDTDSPIVVSFQSYAMQCSEFTDIAASINDVAVTKLFNMNVILGQDTLSKLLAEGKTIKYNYVTKGDVVSNVPDGDYIQFNINSISIMSGTQDVTDNYDITCNGGIVYVLILHN